MNRSHRISEGGGPAHRLETLSQGDGMREVTSPSGRWGRGPDLSKVGLAPLAALFLAAIPPTWPGTKSDEKEEVGLSQRR